MGCLVDVFVIKIKPVFEDANFDELVGELPGRYAPMFSALWNEFQSIEEIMDQRHLDITFDIAQEFENDDCNLFFLRRYRHESLYQIMRTTFFDTILILQNQYDEQKLNKCVIINKRDVIGITLPETATYTFSNDLEVEARDFISEKQWKEGIPKDQQFVQSAITDLEDNGFTVYSDACKGDKDG